MRGKIVKEKNRRYFVYYGRKTVITGKLMARGTMSVAFFTAVALFIGFMTNEKTKAVAVALLCYAVPYMGANLLLALKVRLRLASQCIAKGMLLITTSVLFLLVSVMITQAFEGAAQITVVLVGGYFLFIGAWMAGSWFFIDRGAFRNKKDVQRKNIWMFALGGSLLGINLSKTFSPLLNQSAIYMVYTACVYILAVWFSTGMVYWMKFYLIKKYGFADVEIDADKN
jgi:hypothetical protein